MKMGKTILKIILDPCLSLGLTNTLHHVPKPENYRITLLCCGKRVLRTWLVVSAIL